MRTQISAAAAMVLGLACLAEAQELRIPKSMPVFCVAKLADDGVIEITESQPVTVSKPMIYVVKVPVTERVDGKIVTTFREEKRTRVVQVTEFITRTTNVLPQICSFTAAAGAKLDSDEAFKRLAKPARVVLLRGGQPLDPYFADVLRPETLVISIKQ